jgi:hypothetical protein
MNSLRYDRRVKISRASGRAYREAYHRRVHGTHSREWQKRPGDKVSLGVWMTAFEIAAEENVSPWDALLLAVRRRAARVRMIDRVLAAAWEQHRVLCQQHDGDPLWNPEVPNPEVRSWMVESRNEERLMTRVAKMAIDAGVAKMMIERDQLEGRLLADALVAGLDSLDLTADQRMKALGEAQRVLTQIGGSDDLPGISPHTGTIIPGVTTDDVDGDDDDKDYR